MTTQSAASKLLAAMIVAAASFAAIPRAAAQSHAPDVLILVRPVDSYAGLSVTFTSLVPHSNVQRMLQSLARAGGWRLSSLAIEDETPTVSQARIGPQTGADARITGSPLVSGAAFRLQPFVDTFSAFNRVELIYMTSPVPGFDGLEYFDSPYATVNLTGVSPYRYVFTFHQHLASMPTLPLKQTIAAVSSLPSKSGARSPVVSEPGPTAIGAVAAAAGLLTYALLRAYSRLRGRRRPNVLPKGMQAPVRDATIHR